MLVEIEQRQVDEVSTWTPPDSDRTLTFQSAWFYINGSKHPKEARITVDAPFGVGFYECNLEEIVDVKDGKLKLKRIELIPSIAPKATKAS